MNDFPGFKGQTAVLTGAASGFGLECARIAARAGMHVVMVDVQADALEVAAVELQWLASQVDGGGGRVVARRVDVSSAAEMEALAAEVQQAFGAPSVVFNNAGVGSGGLAPELLHAAISFLIWKPKRGKCTCTVPARASRRRSVTDAADKPTSVPATRSLP